MNIFLGNLMPEQIERLLGIELSEKDKALLIETHQAKINDTPLEHGKWHCYDLPFMFMTHDMETAIKFRDLFLQYDQSTFKESFQIGWERSEDGRKGD